MDAMHAFAACAGVTPEPAGYCRASLTTAEKLANHDVCTNGATQNIGFHIRVPFRVTTPGDYSFRMHADYGLGSFIGVDGSSYTPGNIYGHISVDGTALTVRAQRGRLSAISVFLCKSVLYGAFVWARSALNSRKRRFPARAGRGRPRRPPHRHGRPRLPEQHGRPGLPPRRRVS